MRDRGKGNRIEESQMRDKQKKKKKSKKGSTQYVALGSKHTQHTSSDENLRSGTLGESTSEV
jgi:hypothetical protein